MNNTFDLTLTSRGYKLGNQLLGYTKIDSEDVANIIKKDKIKLNNDNKQNIHR